MSDTIELAARNTEQFRAVVQQKLAELVQDINNPSQCHSQPYFGFLDQQLQLLVVGCINSGKSSLISELFGGDIVLPSSELPCTGRWVQVVYSDEPYMHIIDSGVRLTKQFYYKKSRRRSGSKVPVTDMNEWYDDKDHQGWRFAFSVDDTVQGRVVSSVANLNPACLHCPPFDNEINLLDDDRENMNKLSCYVKIGIPSKLLKHGLQIIDTPGLGENELLDNLFGAVMKATFPNPFLLIYVYDSRYSLSATDIRYLEDVMSHRCNGSASSNELLLPTILVANKIDANANSATADCHDYDTAQGLDRQFGALLTLHQDYQSRFPERDLCKISTLNLKSIRLNRSSKPPTTLTNLHLNCLKSLERSIADEIHRFSWLSYKRLIYVINRIPYSWHETAEIFYKCLRHISRLEQLFVAPNLFKFLHNFDSQSQRGSLPLRPSVNLDSRSLIYNTFLDDDDRTSVEIAVHLLTDTNGSERSAFCGYLSTLFNADRERYIVEPIAKYYNWKTGTLYLMFLKPGRRLLDQAPGLDLESTEKYIKDLWLVLSSLNEWHEANWTSFVIDEDDEIRIDSCRFSLTRVVVLGDRVVTLDQTEYSTIPEVLALYIWLLLEGSGKQLPTFLNNGRFSDPDSVNEILSADSGTSHHYRRPPAEWPDRLTKTLHFIWTTEYSDRKYEEKLGELLNLKLPQQSIVP